MPLIDHIPDLPDEYLAEIGRITSRWSVVESLLHICLIRFSGGDPLDARWLVLFTHMNAQQKLDAFGALLNELKGGGHADALKLLRSAKDQRNAVIHATWEYDNGILAMGKHSAHGKLKIEGKPTTVAELREVAELM